MKPCHATHPESVEGCRLCHLATHDRRYQRLWGLPETGPAPPPKSAPKHLPVLPPCVHLGARVTGQPCGSPLLRCNLHGDVTARIKPCEGAQRCCANCPDYPRLRNSGIPEFAPANITRIDPKRLDPADEPRKFNCSVLDFQGRRLLAYRSGWTHASIHIAELGAGLQPVSTAPIVLEHPQCVAGQEDPRLFLRDGNLRLAFAGLQFVGGRLIVSQMLASLTPDLVAGNVWEPKYKRRTLPMEKNWQFFERGVALLAVYSVRPHRILHLIDGIAIDAHETPGPMASIWPGWTLRGGAPPVRVGDEYYSFFHGWKRSRRPGTPSGDWYDYAAGVYTFEARAPFAVKRITRAPIWFPDARLDHLNVTRDKTVIYPSGAILDGNRWLVSAGHQDTECVIGEFPVEQIERALEPL